RPAFICTVPTLLNGIMNHPMARQGKVDFSTIKLCFSGAAPLMAETKKRFEELTGGVIVEDRSADGGGGQSGSRREEARIGGHAAP
ncbi:MAG TPA: AMP-binding protein, partial [Gemmatimonadaceae bacterium]|nr:AMP-binding protein [Gemmatimonadaceae bacterium]